MFDSFRFIKPTARECTFKDISRIDMIFMSHRLLKRTQKVAHKDLAPTITSDHGMVMATILMRGAEHLTDGKVIEGKKPIGSRFQFRDATVGGFQDQHHGAAR